MWKETFAPAVRSFALAGAAPSLDQNQENPAPESRTPARSSRPAKPHATRLHRVGVGVAACGE